MAPIMSLTAANYNTPEWAELLIRSIRKFTSVPYEIIIIDNGSLPKNKAWLKGEAAAGRIRLCENAVNIGHGASIDQGAALARGRFICAMDIDSFFMRSGWDTDLIALYESDPAIRLIARRGRELSVTSRPLNAPIFLYEREFAASTGLTMAYKPGQLKGSTDSTQAAYWQIVDAGLKVHLLDGIGPMAQNPGGGDITEIAGKPTIYHHGYGSRFGENDPRPKPTVVDGRTLESHLARKSIVFGLPMVKEILAWN